MNTKLISSKLDDFFFIKFPIWIPLAYYFFINSFPSLSLYALIFLLLVGEIHFGITFAFFLTEITLIYLLITNTSMFFGQ